MKYKILFILLLVSSSLFSQRKGRYYPSLDNVFLTQDFEGLPNEFKFFEDWCKTTIDRMYYANLQSNQDPKQTASFNQLNLIVKKNYSFDFFRSGLKLNFKKDEKVNQSTASILNNNYWKVFAYHPHFSFQDFDPQNNEILFLYFQLVNNITNNEQLSHFVNRFSDSNSEDFKGSPLQVFIQKVNKKNNINIDTNTPFNFLCDSIKSKSNNYCNLTLFHTFLEDKDSIETRENILKFYNSHSVWQLQKLIDEYLLPLGNIQFTSKNVNIELPKKYFLSKGENKTDTIQFNLKNIKYNLRYDFDKAAYYMVIKLEPHKGSLNHNFDFKGVVLNMGKKKNENISINKNEFESIEIQLYANFFSIEVFSKGHHQGSYKLTDSFTF